MTDDTIHYLVHDIGIDIGFCVIGYLIVDIDVVLTSYSRYRSYKSIELFFGGCSCIEVSYECNTDGLRIIETGVCADDIMTTCTPFVDLAVRSDDIIVTYIASSSLGSMKIIDLIQCFFGAFAGAHIGHDVGGMMDDDLGFLFFVRKRSSQKLRSLLFDY